MKANRFSFPAIPGYLVDKYWYNETLPVLRSPGLCEIDLEIDFHQTRRPYLVTQILVNFTENGNGGFPDEDFIWDLPISTRTEALAAIALTGTGSQLELQLTCHRDACAENMEMSFSMQEIADLSIRSQERENKDGLYVIPFNRKAFHFRKPTGRDQKEWLAASPSFKGEDALMHEMIHRLLVKNNDEQSLSNDPQWLAAIDEGMKEIDPLVHLELTVFCPACDHKNVYPLDLEALLLQRLKRIQRDLLHTVHRLASQYHWSEQQVFSVSPQRRSDYLALIEGDSR